MTLVRSLVKTTLILLGALVATSSQAGPSPKYRALIVGVSDYPNLKDKNLLGPKNDAISMRDLLVARGVSPKAIEILADGVSTALPTRANILTALDGLAKTATPGTYIVIQMSGHGSQVPVPDGSPYAAEEPDGLFEIFLPRDVSGWKGGAKGAVENAILDREIRERVDKMTAAGAFVWAIFDTCHSATMVRGEALPGGLRLRQVAPGELGVPEHAMARSAGRVKPAQPTNTSASRRIKSATAGRNPSGNAVYFYAAQTHESAPELPLPAGAPDRVTRGLFSFTIAQALEGGVGMTYHQLAQQVLSRYAGNGDARATPLFSGTALDTGVLGQPVTSVRQWTLMDGPRLAIPAGELADVYPGAILAVLPSALAGVDKTLGYVRVTRTEATRAELVPIAHAGLGERSVESLKYGKVVRMAQPALRFSLVVAADLTRCSKPCPFAEPLAQIRSGNNSDAGTSAPVRWVNSDDAAQMLLKAEGRRLWLVPAGYTLEANPDSASGRPTPEKNLTYLEASPTAAAQRIQADVEKLLRHASKAARLMRVAVALSGSAASSVLAVQIRHVPRQGSESLITGASIPRVRDGDRFRVEMRNTGRTALDVTALYLDSQFGITALFPGGGASNRIEAASPSARAVSFEFTVSDSTLGLERLMFIGVEAQEHAERADYSFLEQETMPQAIVSRGQGTDIFRDAGFADYTTRGEPSAPPSTVGMLVYAWQVVK